MANIYLHLKGNTIASVQGQTQTYPQDEWLGGKIAPANAVHVGDFNAATEIELLHGVAKVKVKLFGFVNVTIGENIEFDGVIEVWSA